MLHVVEGSLIRIKNVVSTNVVQQYISFVSVVRAQFEINLAAKCLLVRFIMLHSCIQKVELVITIY